MNLYHALTPESYRPSHRSLSSICSCYFDYVAIYEGDSVKHDKRIALVCGNLTANLPTFKSESNSMVVNFNADSTRHFEGFTAKVRFTTLCKDLLIIESDQFRHLPVD